MLASKRGGFPPRLKTGACHEENNFLSFAVVTVNDFERDYACSNASTAGYGKSLGDNSEFFAYRLGAGIGRIQSSKRNSNNNSIHYS
jgi:hypothetical protein